jgi:hypothetical protein
MAEWRIAGTYIEGCNCDPGCGCNFRGVPSSPEGNCEAFLGHLIERGEFDGLDLSGSKVAWALWWPGAIHERGGHGHAYVDCESDEQFDALRRMWRGEEGYGLYEIFNSTFVEPSAVDRAEVKMTVDGRNSRFSVDGVGEAALTPLTSPVEPYDVNNVRIVKDKGFIWRDGQIAQSKRLHVDLPEMKYDLSGRHAVFARFGYSNVAGFEEA